MGANGSLFSHSWADLTGWLRKKPKEEDRRAENRLPVHDQAQLSWRLDSEPSKSATANLIDISSLGFKVRCSEKIPVGTQVRLTDSAGKTADATIVYSERDDDAYLLGAQAIWEAPRSKASNNSGSAETAA